MRTTIMESPRSSHPAPNAAPLPTGKQVLVVEDEQRVRTMLGQALKEMGFTATFAPSAEAALRAVMQQSFDILILDLNLPGMSGIEFLERVRARQSDVQVIILTGFGDLEAARKAIHLDVVEFLTKPCALGNLEMALSRAMKRRKGQIVSEAASSNEPALRLDEPKHVPAFSEPPADSLSMEDVEQRHIMSVLEKNKGNRAATAAELGISVRKLYYRLGEYQRRAQLQQQRESSGPS